MAWEKGPHNSSPLLQLLFMSVCLFLADAQLGGKARRANAFREPFANSIQVDMGPRFCELQVYASSILCL